MSSQRRPAVNDKAPPRARSCRYRGVVRGLTLVGAVVAVTGCSADWHSRRADDSVRTILSIQQDATLGSRADWVRYPEEAPPPASATDGTGESDAVQLDDEAEATGGNSTDGPPNLISLADSLAIASDTNRDFLSQRESLYLTALSLHSTRHDYSPQVNAAIAYLLRDSTGSARSQSTTGSASVSQRLPFGGSISINGSSNFFDDSDSSAESRPSISSAAGVNLNMPLLRGAGYEVEREALTQAERTMVYEIRNFELFREDFSIDIANRYYSLVRQRREIRNQSANLDDLAFDRRQAEALFNVGRTKELDVLRARREYLNSQNSLLESKESFQLALDRFKIVLGLSIETRIDIADEAPDFIPMNLDVESAIEVALHNRLDYINRVEQVEDSARALRISRNNLLPDLDLNLDYNTSSLADASFARQEFEDRSYSVGLALDIPLDRVRERNSYKSQLISHRRALRSLDEFRENLVLEIRSAFRELKRRESSLDIQRELIFDQEKNLKIARIRFEQGTIGNRDVVEAQESLTDARNSLIQEQVNYEIARLQLLRDLGILFIDDKGMWMQP